MATILLVDDDRMILEFCDRVLAGLSGFYVLQADSGAEALDTAARYPGTIDLLIADIMMPGGIDGVELARRVAVSRPRIQVLLMSGYQSEAFALRDSWQFLSKPFRAGDLVSKVEEILATRCSAPRWTTSSGRQL
jgi:DNA-binding NtrC family response regulator